MVAANFRQTHGPRQLAWKVLGFSVNVRVTIHRVTMTSFRCICIPAGFRRHLVGKSLRNVTTVLSLKYTLSGG